MDPITIIVATGVVTVVGSIFVAMFKDAGEEERLKNRKLDDALDSVYDFYANFDFETDQEPVSLGDVNKLKALLPRVREKELDRFVRKFITSHRQMMYAKVQGAGMWDVHQQTRVLETLNQCRQDAANIMHWINSKYRREGEH